MSQLTDQQRASFERDGFVVLPALVVGADLDLLVDECMLAWSAVKGPYDPDGTWLHNALLPMIHHHSAAVRRYYYGGPLVTVAEQLIGPDIKGAASQLTFKLRGNQQAFGWHQDNGYGELDPANAISTLTALDVADEENGCLWVLPGSHRQGQVDISDSFGAAQKASGAELTMEVADAASAVPVRMQPGDVIVLHSHVLHCSHGNASATRDRRILFLRYADADAVEVYNQGQPRVGPLLRGTSRFSEVSTCEQEWVRECGT